MLPSFDANTRANRAPVVKEAEVRALSERLRVCRFGKSFTRRGKSGSVNWDGVMTPELNTISCHETGTVLWSPHPSIFSPSRLGSKSVSDSNGSEIDMSRCLLVSVKILRVHAKGCELMMPIGRVGAGNVTSNLPELQGEDQANAYEKACT